MPKQKKLLAKSNENAFKFKSILPIMRTSMWTPTIINEWGAGGYFHFRINPMIALSCTYIIHSFQIYKHEVKDIEVVVPACVCANQAVIVDNSIYILHKIFSLGHEIYTVSTKTYFWLMFTHEWVKIQITWNEMKWVALNKTLARTFDQPFSHHVQGNWPRKQTIPIEIVPQHLNVYDVFPTNKEFPLFIAVHWLVNLTISFLHNSIQSKEIVCLSFYASTKVK